MSDQDPGRGLSGSADRPPYDGTRWGKTVPAIYLGFERVADDFFMHRVRSESGLESTVAPYNVYGRRVRADGEHWESLTQKPRVR